MKSKLLTSWSLIWLVATVLLAAGAALNLSERAVKQFPPADGVNWVQKADGIYAEKVTYGMAASRAGISPGAKLLEISLDGQNYDEVISPADVQMYLHEAGVGGKLSYFYENTNYSLADRFYFADLTNIDTYPRWTPSIIFLSIVGFIWLVAGLFVLLKQGSGSPFVLHFAVLCLTAFVFHVYKPIGLGRDFDLAATVLDDIAFALFSAIFLHFCLRYPVRSQVFDEKRWKTYLIYVPAAILIAASIFFTVIPFVLPQNAAIALNLFVSRIDLFTLLNNALLIYFVAGISAGASILVWRFFATQHTLVKQRLKWAMFGTLLAVIPILVFQIAKRFVYLPEDTLTVALITLPLALIPLSFGHSVVRYRLMDVDIVVRRALVYAMTTLAIAMMIGTVALGLVFLAVRDDLSTAEITLRALIAVIAMAAIVMLSEPLKKFLQDRANRYFYGERYDLRQGLLDFGRTISATTAMEPLLNALTERIQQVLDVEKVAIFIEDKSRIEEFRIAKSIGISNDFTIPANIKLLLRQKTALTGVLRADEIAAANGDVPATNGNGNGNGNSNGNGASKLLFRHELHYYVPCVVRSKMVAFIGLGRTRDGSLLSSEDLDILKALAGYIAVAIENSRLYQEQQQHTEELALLKEFNESIIESVNVGLIAVDEEGRITRCNSTFEQMMAATRDAVIGKQVEDVFDEHFMSHLTMIIGQKGWRIDDLRNAYKLHTVNNINQPLTLNIAIAPLRSDYESQKGAIIVLEDVTSRVKLEEGLQQNEKLSSIGLLAAGVAHEVNTPLTGVSSYTQMLLGMIPETDPKHALLEKMQKQTERATNIVGNLLNFSRTGNAMEWMELDINRLLDDTLQLLEPQLRKSNVEIIKDYSVPPPKVYGNSGKLQQVFTNLILNARDALFNGGHIKLNTGSNDDGGVCIKVTDNGEGIRSENLNKIFDPFFTTKGVGNGTGLGLAVTYGIVQEHNGTIKAESEFGDGTTFTILLPAPADVRQRIAG